MSVKVLLILISLGERRQQLQCVNGICLICLASMEPSPMSALNSDKNKMAWINGGFTSSYLICVTGDPCAAAVSS